MRTAKIDTSGTEMAQRAIADANIASRNLQQNMQADLGIDNIADIVPGGTAAMQPGTNTKRKRSGSNSIAASLGLDL